MGSFKGEHRNGFAKWRSLRLRRSRAGRSTCSGGTAEEASTNSLVALRCLISGWRLLLHPALRGYQVLTREHRQSLFVSDHPGTPFVTRIYRRAGVVLE